MALGATAVARRLWRSKRLKDWGNNRMIAAFDVYYLKKGCASAAAVLFSAYSEAEPEAVYTLRLHDVEDYIPGEFYRRELPCILKLLGEIKEPLEEMIIDGYVTLGDRPGLGRHLFDFLKGEIPVIGVAKSKFKGSRGMEVFRGNSRKPLYVTSAGVNLPQAGEKIRTMHGPYRIPTLLKLADLLARENARRLRQSGSGCDGELE